MDNREDLLTDRFTAFGVDAARAVRLAPSGRVRARGDRRRIRLTAGVAVVGAGIVGVAGTTALQPADPPTSTLPSSFVMPHEGEPGWERSDALDAPSAVLPCTGIDLATAQWLNPGLAGASIESLWSDPTLTGRTDARTLVGSGNTPNPEVVGDPNFAESSRTPPSGSARYVEQVLVYRDEAAARAAYDGLIEQAKSCQWSDLSAGGGSVFARAMTAFRAGQRWEDFKDTMVVFVRGNVVATFFERTNPFLMPSDKSRALLEVDKRLCDTMRVCRA